MTRKLTRLDSILSRDWPTAQDIQSGLVFEPKAKLNEIREALDSCGKCIIVGPPRSGKTTLTRLIGWNTWKEEGKNVWFLDMRDMQSSEDVEHSVDFEDDRSHLYIIENWHAMPNYQQYVSKAIETHNSNAQYLITFTAFSKLQQLELVEDLGDTPLVVVMPQHFARGIIDKYIAGDIHNADRREEFLTLYKEAPSEHKLLSVEDYQKCLRMDKREKRIRGNLRFLKHRLDVWDPTICPLHEVSINQVKSKLKQELKEMYKSESLLWEIAVACQWELPFFYRGSYPKEADILVEKNIIIPTIGGWRMDSTDAYLFLRARYSLERWKQFTIEGLKEYMKKQRELTMICFSHLNREPTGRYIAQNLLRDAEYFSIIKEELAHLTNQSNPNTAVFFFINNLFQAIWRTEKEAQKKLAEIECLLENVDAIGLGKSAHLVSLQPIGWFLKYVLREPNRRFDHFLLTFLCAHGLDELRTKLEDALSGATQRMVLKHIGHLEPALGNWLRPVKLGSKIRKPQSRKLTYRRKYISRTIEISKLIGWLNAVLVEWGLEREKWIQWINGFDEVDLEKRIQNSPNPMTSLSRIQYTVNWLDSETARRLSEWIPQIIRSLLTVGDGEWPSQPSLLIRNCRLINAASARSLVRNLLEEPADKLLPLPTDFMKSDTLHNFVRQAGLANAEVTNLWCNENVLYWSNAVAVSANEKAWKILIELHRFSPNTASQIIGSLQVQLVERIEDSITLSALPFCGILALYNVTLPQTPLPILDDMFQELECIESLDELILAVYAIQIVGRAEIAQALHQRLTASPVVPPNVMLNLVRHPLPWKAENVSDMLNAPFYWHVSYVDMALHRVILIYLSRLTSTSCQSISIEDLESSLNKDTMYDFAIKSKSSLSGVEHEDQERRRRLTWLATAIHERVFWCIGHNEANQPLWTLNNEHTLVRCTVDKVRKVLNTLQQVHEQHQQGDLEQWDNMIVGESMAVPEADYWRYRLIEIGAIQYTQQTNGQPNTINFSLGKENPLIRGIDLLPPNRSS